MATDQKEPTEAPQAMSQESRSAKLDQLKVSAMREYALKNYAAAAELYSEAAELQDEVNGEMSLENADVLYHYGRALYHVGVSKSDVLGGRVAQQEEPKRKKRKIQKDDEPSSSSVGVEPSVAAVSKQGEKPPTNGDAVVAAASTSKFFQITGDENWTDSEEEDADEAEGDGEEEEDDDLAIAYEILDTARVLFKRKIDGIMGNTGTATSTLQTESRALKERLADTHDLQAEIKLENEQFEDAVNDAREALAIKLELFPQESGMVAEAHYKLSIALDFASLPTQPAEGTEAAEVKQEEGKVDEGMRQEAAEQMEKAIMSCQARIKKEETQLAGLDGNKLESAKRGIADTQDMIKDMRVRLADLRSSPATIPSASGPALDGEEMRGVMGQLLGSSKAEHARRITEVTQQANDLSGLIKQKKKPKVEPSADTDLSEGKGKRKAEHNDTNQVDSSKRVKFGDDI